MKYIRTKDNVYLKIRDTEYENKHIVVGKTPIDFGTYILKKDVIKQADTIEELCDGFYIDVCEPIFEKQFIYSKEEYYDFHYVITQCLKENGVKYTAYGFIKTDKGLIYVAKMNENGELELI